MIRALTACVGDDPVAPVAPDAGPVVDANVGTDGSSPDVTQPDSATASCDRTKPFGAPNLVSELNTAFDDAS